MNELINQQRERIAGLEAEVERLKEWYVTGEKQLKGRQDYARDQLQRAETAEQRVKELEEINDIMLTRLMAAALALASGRKCADASEALNQFAIDQKVEALENAIQENSFDNEDINAEVIYVDDLRADIEQLRAKLGGDE